MCKLKYGFSNPGKIKKRLMVLCTLTRPKVKLEGENVAFTGKYQSEYYVILQQISLSEERYLLSFSGCLPPLTYISGLWV